MYIAVDDWLLCHFRLHLSMVVVSSLTLSAFLLFGVLVCSLEGRCVTASCLRFIA